MPSPPPAFASPFLFFFLWGTAAAFLSNCAPVAHEEKKIDDTHDTRATRTHDHAACVYGFETYMLSCSLTRSLSLFRARALSLSHTHIHTLSL